jgi:hypothetical protein
MKIQNIQINTIKSIIKILPKIKVSHKVYKCSAKSIHTYTVGKLYYIKTKPLER